MSDIFYVDGAFVKAEDARIPVTDLAVLRGYGIFDFLRTYHGKPLHLEANIQRLFNSAAEIGLTMPWSPDEVLSIVMQTLERNDHAESQIRIVVTGGTSSNNITPGGVPRLLVLVTPVNSPSDHYYTDGAKIITVRESRYLPRAKSINYIPAIRALEVANANDAVEAIYVNPNSQALEGTTTNLFIFQKDELITPEESILPGITRTTILKLVRDTFTVKIRDIHLDELYEAEEIFITAANKQIMPIVQVDDQIIGTGKPGRLTRQVMSLFGEYTGVPLP